MILLPSHVLWRNHLLEVGRVPQRQITLYTHSSHVRIWRLGERIANSLLFRMNSGRGLADAINASAVSKTTDTFLLCFAR